jgi:hypothetical protein
LDAIVDKYGSEANYRSTVGGRVCTDTKEVQRFMMRYLADSDLDQRCVIDFKPGMLSRLSWEGYSSNENYIHVALPLRIHANTLKGACHHEIGTHMVRFCNNHKQLWHVSGPGANAKRHRFGLSPVYSPGLEATEEGLAVLNSSFDTEGKSLYYSALHYYAICMSHELDFVGLFDHMARYINEPDRRWTQCARTRKGLADQNVPGAFNRDQQYFRGAVELLQRRHSIDWRLLHSTKISLSDYDRVKDHIRTGQCCYPSFLDDIPKYMSHLDEVARQNFVEDLVPAPLATGLGGNGPVATEEDGSPLKDPIYPSYPAGPTKGCGLTMPPARIVTPTNVEACKARFFAFLERSRGVAKEGHAAPGGRQGQVEEDASAAGDGGSEGAGESDGTEGAESESTAGVTTRIPQWQFIHCIWPISLLPRSASE